MLTVNSISKSYGIDPILENISFTLNSGERLGLVGPNGCGKTTLLRILAGLEKPDRGTVAFHPGSLQVGYLPQGLSPEETETVGGFLDRMQGDLGALTRQVEHMAASLAKTPGKDELGAAYDHALAQLEAAAVGLAQRPATLAALGLDAFEPETPVAFLSGGQKTRLALAGVLLSSPQLLLLDEPTNHLDIDMLEWLEGWLQRFPGGVLVVSHDRIFLDRVASGILEIDLHTHLLRAYAGSYSMYMEQKLAERARHAQEYSDWQEEIARLKRAATILRGQAVFRRGGKADSGDKFAKGFFANRSRRTVGRAKHVEHRLESLLTDERVEKPRQSWQMKLDFGKTPSSSRDVLVLEGLAAGYGEKVLLKDVNLSLRYGARAVLVGPNGAGKTTLLRTIAGQLPPLAGMARLGPSIRLGYMAQEQEDLDPAIDVYTTVRSQAPFSETDARAFLHQFLFAGDDVFKPVGSLSYGERARLSLACLVARGCNLLLLDEPINHLDIPSRARFEQSLADFQGTVLAVVHDRFFIDAFATEIWEARDGQVRRL